MLEYDNSAFYYFSLTLLTIYLLPGYYYLFKELYAALFSAPSSSDGTAPRTELERLKASKLRSKVQGIARLQRWPFLTNLVALAITTAIFVYLISLVIKDGEVSTFDPYAILGIDSGASLAEIKRSYRKLSLKFHPDKNIGSKVAEEMFMKIAKAYEALTDETSKENYEKFGNPDGKQSLEVSIGLPSIILENPKVVLVLYLVAMVVVIPVAVGLWYSNSKLFGEKNILYESYTAFYQLLTETHRVKHMPEVMAASAECRQINAPRPEDAEPLAALKNRMKSDKLMHKPKYEQPFILKGNLLIHAHVLRLTSDLTPAFRADLDRILVKAPELIEGMIEIAQQRRWLHTTMAAVRFQQCIVQALWYTDSPFLQLPHLTEADGKLLAKAASSPARALAEFLRTPDQDKKGLSRLSDAERLEVLAASRLLPRVTVAVELFVEENEDAFNDDDEDDKAAAPATADTVTAAPAIRGDHIYENDLVTLRLTLTREHVPEGGEAAPAHAPLFPAAIRECWWVVLTDKVAGDASGEAEAPIHAIEKISEQARVVRHELRFMAPARQGEHRMQLRLLSDAYLGLDEDVDVSFTVRPAADLPAYAPHPEDVELDNEPTLFEQVMTADMEDSSDDEDEADEADASTTAAASAAAGLKRSAVKAMSSPIVMDEDSEEED